MGKTDRTMINPLGGFLYIDGVKAFVTELRAEYFYRLVYRGPIYVLTLYFTERPPKRIRREAGYREIRIPQEEGEEWGLYRVVDHMEDIDQANRRYIKIAVHTVMIDWQDRDAEVLLSDRSHGDIVYNPA